MRDRLSRSLLAGGLGASSSWDLAVPEVSRRELEERTAEDCDTNKRRKTNHIQNNDDGAMMFEDDNDGLPPPSDRTGLSLQHAKSHAPISTPKQNTNSYTTHPRHDSETNPADDATTDASPDPWEDLIAWRTEVAAHLGGYDPPPSIHSIHTVESLGKLKPIKKKKKKNTCVYVYTNSNLIKFRNGQSH